MLRWNDSSGPAPLLGVGPSVDATHVDADHVGDVPVSAALPNDVDGRVAHGGTLRYSQLNCKHEIAIFATDFRCEIRNTSPMAKVDYVGWIREQLDRKGVRQADLARALKLAPDKLSKIMIDERDIKVEELRMMIEYFGTTPPGFTPATSEQAEEIKRLLEMITDPRIRSIAIANLKNFAVGYPEDSSTEN